MKPFNTMGGAEFQGLRRAFEYPLSGYLAGRARGGFHVCELEDAWSKTFGPKHAIAVNSATSGLLAAAFAIGLTAGKYFAVPALTMSATAAAPMFTGAEPIFIDVDEDDFTIQDHDLPYDCPVFATNLFGHPARLHNLRKWCDLNHTYLIEDNAQAPYAMENGRFTGNIGHIGVWSLNIHKPIQCGEGGMVTTNDDELAMHLRNFINHGENIGDQIGLNLRMPELCAAVAREQLRRGDEIVDTRVDQAIAIGNAIGPGEIPGLVGALLNSRKRCRNVFYTIPFLLSDEMRVSNGNSDVNAMRATSRIRKAFCASLREDGIPIVEGYAGGPLYRLPAFAPYARSCPVAEDLHDRRLFYFENCAWDLDSDDLARIGAAFRKAAEKFL